MADVTCIKGTVDQQKLEECVVFSEGFGNERC